MRTTLNIADDVLLAARDRAQREKKSIGLVISELARRAMTESPATPVASAAKPLFGLRPFPKRGGSVSNEAINRLRENKAY